MADSQETPSTDVVSIDGDTESVGSTTAPSSNTPSLSSPSNASTSSTVSSLPAGPPQVPSHWRYYKKPEPRVQATMHGDSAPGVAAKTRATNSSAASGAAFFASDFLGEVTQELTRQQGQFAQQAELQPAPQRLELKVRRDTAVSVSNCLWRRKTTAECGQLTVSASSSSFVHRGSQQLPDLQKLARFAYSWWQTPVNDADSTAYGNGSASSSAATFCAERGADREDASGLQLSVDTTARELSLSVPVPVGGFREDFVNVLTAWTSVAARALAGVTAGAASVGLSQVLQSAGSAGSIAASSLPLKLGGFGGSLVDPLAAEGIIEQELATHVGFVSLTSAVMFIGSIRGLNKHSTAQQGNVMGMVATALGILSVLLSPGFNGAHVRFFATFFAASILGYGVAKQVKMEDMPQLVAGFHSFVGLAAVFAGFANFFAPGPFSCVKALEMFVGTGVGALTFTGSVVAAGKLHGLIPGRPIILDRRWFLNIAGAASSCLLGLLFTNPAIYATCAGTACLMANTVLWGGLGANMVLPIGGADMPVVVSLLNACSGLATSAAGFMLSNNLLTITGALVASSGTLLSDIMCRGINRSMYNVLLGGFGTDGGGVVASPAGISSGSTNQVSASGCVGMLLAAKNVVIVPGYGLAVARCQRRLAEIVDLLRKHGVTVHFAIHPVAGRLPGHMNVLLAEADVPYDIVREMEDINAELPQYDVAIIVGANDIVNPATQTDPHSPIYGMPAIEVWQAKSVVVMKRSMATGYSGVDNPLFYLENVHMLFGNASQSMDSMFSLLQDAKDEFVAASAGVGESLVRQSSQDSRNDYPVASKTVGIIRERRSSEQRVSMTPAVVPKLRRLGFSILLEAGAGSTAGFTDEEYVQQGGVQVAESATEVLQQADVVLKVNEPLLDEVQHLKREQTMVGFWNMFGTEDLTKDLGQSKASFVNLALIPRVSRAQKLDALTSMANIAGYKAVLDAFNRLPRFSRSSVTASGTVAPAKVFIIGAGVAGLSAIATAHSLGAKVFANDVRDAAREQVESMGAEFVSIGMQGIAGEGVGGYATEMGEAFKQAQLATYARVIRDVDVVITTAIIPNRKAPTLITEDMVNSMKSGSVIVDLAAQTGGNCALTRKDEVNVVESGVTIIGETNYPSSMPAQASELLGNNFVALLEVLGGASSFGGEHWEDPVIKAATVVHKGKLRWPPAPPAPPPPAPPPSQSRAKTTSRPAAQVEEPDRASLAAGFDSLARPPPGEVGRNLQWLLDWLKAHKHELAVALGGATIIGLGITVNIPDEELTHIGYFVLSLLIGHFTVAGVTPALHTPLISVTNAISGIIVVGGMLQLSGPLLSARVACALAAVFLSSINVVGGFAVTQRMLEMFRKKEDEPARGLAR
mmetsp:Transcript_55285/g.103884  ORF Transcript_55285/g.103884 Transcript_55285/m.103884 type:complete len:1383 (-) Transcript_55285:63-4211(-)